MVAHQLAARDITDPRVLAAFEEVPRHRFVPAGHRHAAYGDGPLPIGVGQTISQPYMVAVMVQALRLAPGDVVLEVGAGSGYAAAVFSRIVRRVVAVERLAELADRARAILAELGYDNVEIVEGDGSTGWPAAAPFDAICVSAAAPAVPPALVEQLAAGGRLVVPVGGHDWQTLLRVTKRGDGTTRTDDLGGVRFVPLLGAGGWPA
jgi:protein-L-isoaspartate(D-aspartate) O-methyltransferase